MSESTTARDAARVVEMFLGRVGREANLAGMSGDDRVALVDRLQASIEAAVATARDGEEVTAALAIIDALGEPSAIVAAAMPRSGPTATGPTFTSGARSFSQQAGPAYASASQQFAQFKDRGGIELAACLLIVLHPLVPAIGFLACIVCLVISERWTPGQKMLGVFGALAFTFVGLIGFSAFFVSAGPWGAGAFLGLPAFIFGLLIPIGIAFHLWNEAAIPDTDPYAPTKTVRRVVVTLLAVLLIFAGLSALAAIYVGGW